MAFVVCKPKYNGFSIVSDSFIIYKERSQKYPWRGSVCNYDVMSILYKLYDTAKNQINCPI